ncbi:hypothetical protein STAS_02862 [Striga asiatica]|uniref:Succinate dehydrogenase subunit 6, mitochondrial n=1 Tax=Striga asiatica TaxID=4170 RepID=A0A5A7P3N0_STRAF|nr:hypothetical protein STAS_02862 [Striga asiatica]
MSESHESQSFLRRYWEGYKEFWAERFPSLDNYSKFIISEKPLPHWDSSVVEEFVASDPVHGPTLKATRDAANFGVLGAAIGAVSTGGLAWKWSKSPHGAFLSFALGGVVGATLGLEAAGHWYQLYRLDTKASQVKFYEWLQKRA